MKYKNILLTGGSGTLGSNIINLNYIENIIAPTHDELDICNPYLIEKFFQSNEINAIINCVALARIKECEENPVKALETNVIGTSNLVKEVLRINKSIRFVQISTDGIYQSIKGNYSEIDPTIPYSIYGWTKLGAECAVNLLPNHCIIRTSFFDPKKIKFKDSPEDAYTSKIPVKQLVKAISELLESDFVGTINVGGQRRSYYELYKEFIPNLKSCRLKDLKNNLVPPDSSFDITLWMNFRKD